MKEYRIVHKKIKDLTPYEDNPRIISEKAKSGLAESIRLFGLVDPIIVNKTTGRVVGGHQRLRELASAGVEETDVLEGEMSETDEIALNIALNSEQIQGKFEKSAIKLLDEVKEDLSEVSEKTLLDDLREQLGGKKKEKDGDGGEKKGDEGEPDEPDDDGPAQFEKVIPPFVYMDVRREQFKKADYDAFTVLRNEKTTISHPALIKSLLEWFCPKGGVPGSSDPDVCRVMSLYADKVACLYDEEHEPTQADKVQEGLYRADNVVFRAAAEVYGEAEKLVAFDSPCGRNFDCLLFLVNKLKETKIEIHALEKYKEHPKVQKAIYDGAKVVFHYSDKDLEDFAKGVDKDSRFRLDIEKIVEAARKRLEGVWGQRAVMATTNGVAIAALAKAYGSKVLAVCTDGDVSTRVKRLTTPEEFERIEFVVKSPKEGGVYKGVALSPADECAHGCLKDGDVLVVSEAPEKANLKSGEMVKGVNADFILGRRPGDAKRLNKDRFFALVGDVFPGGRYWTKVLWVDSGSINRADIYYFGETRKIKNVFPEQLSESLELTFMEDENETKGLLYELYRPRV